MNGDKALKVASVLIDIEAELRRLYLWENEAPRPEDLASTQPFCIDTMTFPQWVQHIFLVRMGGLLDSQQALPERCGIEPMAAEYFKSRPESGEVLVRSFRVIDEILR